MRKSFTLVPGKAAQRNVGITIKLQPIPKIIDSTPEPVAVKPEILGFSSYSINSKEVLVERMDFPYVGPQGETAHCVLTLARYIGGPVEWVVAPTSYPGLLDVEVVKHPDFPQFCFVSAWVPNGSTWWDGHDIKEFGVKAIYNGFTTPVFTLAAN